MFIDVRLRQVKAISFDLDDTLWDCAPAIAAGDNALWEWHQRHTPKITEIHTPDSLTVFRSEVRAAHPELQRCVSAMRIKGLQVLFTEFGYPASLAQTAFDVFYRARSQVILYEDALSLLAALKDTYPLVAITNGNADLQQIGVSHFFTSIYAADLTLEAKPSPDMFERCLSELSLSPEALLHIGDNPVTDVIGGHNAGVQTLWFNQYNEEWPQHLTSPHYEVQSLKEIAQLVLGKA